MCSPPRRFGSASRSTLRITVDGSLGAGVTAKDIILAIIARIGTAGATGHVIEYAGSAIRALSIEGRLTLCNMSIEAGARAGMVAPDETTFAYLHGRANAPEGRDWDAALVRWRALPTDPGARFDREVCARCRGHRADGHLGHQPGGRAADHRPRPRSRQLKPTPSAATACAARSTTWG